MNSPELHRRDLLKAVTLGTVGLFQGWRTAKAYRLEGADGSWSSGLDLRPLARFPEKAPMILLTDRPPQLETPLHYLREDFTPNDAFFVRWHFAGIPTEVRAAEWRLEVW
jgi:DMSO/TMAO reductase YedYZ molybdopterin-dependent catalytic subunit